MKALVVKNPDAGLIRAGLKTIETRSWATSYRGPILIVAGRQDNRERMREHGALIPLGDLWRGHAVAIANLTGCLTMNQIHEKAAFVQARPGLFAWYLSEVQRIKPFHVRGQLGIFQVACDPELDDHGPCSGVGLDLYGREAACACRMVDA